MPITAPLSNAPDAPNTRARDTVPASTLTWSAIATLLELPPTPDRDLTRTQVFDGPGGLVCRLVPEHVDGMSTWRSGICIGLHVDDIPATAVGALLAMQATLLASGRWFLGMDDGGLLQLTALGPASNADEVAAGLREGHGAAWATLVALLGPAAVFAGHPGDAVADSAS